MLATMALAFDVNRNQAYINYIKENVKDKVVVDCGSGSGIWTWVSLYYGAKHVYCIDIHQPTIDHLNLLFKDDSRVTVLNRNLFKDIIPRGDIYIQELFGVNPFGEAILNFLRNCKRQQISNVFPGEIKLFSLVNPRTELIEPDYDYSLLDPSNSSFIQYMSDKHQELIDITKFKSMMTSFNFSCSSKTTIWDGSLFDILDGPNLNIQGDAISWEAGSGSHFYSSLNNYYNGWPLGYCDARLFKHSYIKLLGLRNEFARNKVCTASISKPVSDLSEIRHHLYNRN